MPIELGQISFDDELVKQLKHDLKDDWFPDPLEFRDMIDDNLVDDAIVAKFAANHGSYTPSKRALFNLPKPDHTLRYGLETGLPDRLVYHGLVAYLMPFFDPLIPWAVFNHRQTPRAEMPGAPLGADDVAGEVEVDAGERPRTYLFRPSIPVWKDFVGSVSASVVPGSFLLTTDITNYYENIDIEKLKTAFDRLLPSVNASAVEKSKIRIYLELLFQCLSSWTYSERRGLPQNRDASSFLANIYMHEVDVLLIEKGYEYFRYMDDIKIVCGSEIAARRALKELTLSLREIGLAVNSKKTDICSGQDVEKLSQSLDAGDVTMQKLDYAWKSKSLGPIMRTIPHLKALALRELNAGASSVHSREFRFCINRLTTLAGCKELAVPPEYFKEITDAVIRSLGACAAVTDFFAKYLRVAPTTDEQLEPVEKFLMDEERSFYTWQNYRLWLLLVQKGYKSVNLINYAVSVVQGARDTAHRAGATLYIGAFGSAADRTEVARHFSAISSFIGQRCAVIAVQELPFKPSIQDHVAPSLRDDLKGVYRSLHHHRKDSYSTKPEPVSIFHVIDSERDYV